MPIYTKKGDKGETGLPGKRRLPKTEAIFDFLGTLDETNAVVGLVISALQLQGGFKNMVDQLTEIQRNFLSIGACVAAEKPAETPILTQLDSETAKLEQQIDDWDKDMPELKNFILPGGSPAGATLHLARTAIRRAERNYHRCQNPEELEPIARYLNRLSDFFFQAARFCNFKTGTEEEIWRQS